MIEFIWKHIELCVLVLLVSQGVIYYRLYLERLTIKDTLERYRKRIKRHRIYFNSRIADNKYAIKSINKYLDNRALQEYRDSVGYVDDKPDLIFYPCDDDRSGKDRRVSDRRCK